ncbi:unnamed protein product [Cylindrotheca closterium]|uniref:Uncharacterized protein n=1 Tax=Cylindrotheca closterium TaxID=2856 RepID=A0AAD2CMC2_9STRA|nr:unnamed protein product [Cylindrotheca closterium]
MSTANNMNMAQTNRTDCAMNRKRTDEMKKVDDVKRKLFLSKLPAKPTGAAIPISNNRSHSDTSSRSEWIDEALEIINSSSRRVIGRRGPLRRKGSSLSERRASELLKDNSDHLSELLRKSQGGLFDLSSDDESDLED